MKAKKTDQRYEKPRITHIREFETKALGCYDTGCGSGSGSGNGNCRKKKKKKRFVHNPFEI